MSRCKQLPDELWRSWDRKVSHRGSWQDPWRNRPGRWLPSIGNSFGLAAGISCPGRTGFCSSCYGKRSENSPGVEPLVTHNLRLLTEAGTTTAQAALLTRMVGRYEQEADKARLAAEERIFRIHWDGDFFSLGYARAWAATAARFPDVRFWTYTRSFRAPVDVLPVLADVSNLIIYLSVDSANWTRAIFALREHPTVLAAYCADDFEHGRRLARAARRPGDARSPLVCPENAGRVPLMDAPGVGACVSCAACPAGRRDIRFATSHKERAGDPVRFTEPRPGRRDDETYTCALPECARSFTRPAGARGPKPRFCSRDCQVKGYERQRGNLVDTVT